MRPGNCVFCDVKMPLKEMKNHLPTCDWRKIKCRQCDQIYRFKDAYTHQVVCKKVQELRAELDGPTLDKRILREKNSNNSPTNIGAFGSQVQFDISDQKVIPQTTRAHDNDPVIKDEAEGDINDY